MTNKPRETPIERIFRRIMRRKMPVSIRGILLCKSSAKTRKTKVKTSRTSYPNLLDYPNAMSQFEKESLAAEANCGTSSCSSNVTAGGF
jgi:hypothetical protein